MTKRIVWAAAVAVALGPTLVHTEGGDIAARIRQEEQAHSQIMRIAAFPERRLRPETDRHAQPQGSG